jgi:hypothetical protein
MSAISKVSVGGRGIRPVKPSHNPEAKVVSHKEIEERANAVDRAIDERLLQCRLLTIDLQEQERGRKSREAAILKRDLEEIAANGGNVLCGNVLSIKTITPSIINLSFMYLLHKTSIDSAFELHPDQAFEEDFEIDTDFPTLFQVFGESLFPGIPVNDEFRRVANELFKASMEFHFGEGNISSSFYYDDHDRVFSVTPKGNVWFNNRCPGLVNGWIREYRQEIRMKKERTLAKKKKQQEELQMQKEELQIQKELREEYFKGVQLQEELENVTRFREELVKLEKAKSLEAVKEEYHVEAEVEAEEDASPPPPTPYHYHSTSEKRLKEDLYNKEKKQYDLYNKTKQQKMLEVEEDGNIIYGWIQSLDGDSEEE